MHLKMTVVLMAALVVTSVHASGDPDDLATPRPESCKMHCLFEVKACVDARIGTQPQCDVMHEPCVVACEKQRRGSSGDDGDGGTAGSSNVGTNPMPGKSCNAYCLGLVRTCATTNPGAETKCDTLMEVCVPTCSRNKRKVKERGSTSKLRRFWGL